MNRKAFEEKLREIKMSEYDADLYNQFSNAVSKQVNKNFICTKYMLISQINKINKKVGNNSNFEKNSYFY